MKNKSITVREWISTARQKFQDIYDAEESRVMAQSLMEHHTGLDVARQTLSKQELLGDDILTNLNRSMERVLQHEPLQYILGHTWFYGLKIGVEPGVLIPRRETEELVDWVVRFCKPGTKLLDVGTGSGCIAIAVKYEIPDCDVIAWDIEEGALDVARRNAQDLKVDITFQKQDILTAKLPKAKWDIIVSNPPYVTNAEKSLMQPNVLDYEPETALFVEDSNPLIYYETIASFARNHLAKNGLLFFEINEHYPEEILKLLKQMGFENTELRNDMQGKPRMVKASVS